MVQILALPFTLGDNTFSLGQVTEMLCTLVPSTIKGG